MQSFSEGPRVCQNCGAMLQPGHRFCPNCGTAVTVQPSESPPEPDPSTIETSEHAPIGPEPERMTEPPRYDTAYQDPGHPTWGTPETTVPPESGNRTLWIILAIVAFIILVCCCLLPLGLAATAYIDVSLQEDLRSALVQAFT